MKSKIIEIEVKDIRFPTSRNLDGSDAMNAISDYSATYVTLRTDSDDGLVGNGLTFTIGRGNELCVEAVKSLSTLFVQGRYLEDITANFGRYWHELVAGDCQLRWVGPEKGVIHLATAAIINAIWDLWAKKEGKPVWKLLVDMSPEEVVNCVDFTYLADVLTPEEAIAMLRKVSTTKAQREEEMQRDGFPGYTTAAGWLGYSEEKMRMLARQAVADGWTHLKQKVGADIEQDIRRATILREELGWDYKLMMDANQIWSVDQAVENMRRLAKFDPWWIEEPTSPDDILGHAAIRRRIAPIGVATGEHAHNRVMFKQMFQAGSIDFCQLDPARLGGLNEVLAVVLMAAKYNVPVCPHGGGVGLCQYSQNIVLFDYIAVSASLDKRVLEYVDHLHENFLEPIHIKRGRYMPPKMPGYGVTMKEASVAQFEYPNGTEWCE
ncbi:MULTISPECIES: enolase C-terminal domain-like protein [Brenneria]|uniref:L-fuconate dehydratase n=1 Tax=Brenneria nigrifluens DSM 30175 = ATCC 13028 TaxID=1121120 RepID=A0A2U1UQH1_9GAMM|nr:MULTISPECIES: enolase C-terminal domain-like protein [Brenneria]EHD23686.1 Mandelate racemase/muconate lactonizing protein [Brenneria sp. EniD312]PWC23935.1 fuconate dehydratase [Brenneria nigrifluens] [Brenneria nigrifluens DSM 30175 = ATCC 13028]QCR06606.1 fuconate dehydratase [Brenneria nigrifluens] [Brenneria nigrifluens DSM 30175 = ATCC 13028]